MLDTYSKIKAELNDSLTKLENITVSEHVKKQTQPLRAKLDADVFSLAIVGQFKRGKTTFINALLGKDLLPTSIIPLTSVITVLGYGKELRITAFFENGAKKDISVDELPLYVTEKHNPKNEKKVEWVEIAYPSRYLKNGVKIIDTPGIGSVHEHNTETTYAYLSNVDAAIFIISVDPPITQAELNFLSDLKKSTAKIFFIQSKIDTVQESDREESLAFSKKIIEGRGGFGEIEIYPLSVKDALDGKIKNNPQKIEKSGLLYFEKSLEQFLINEKGKILIRSVAEKTKNLIDEEMLLAELEEKSLYMSMQELETKINTFKDFTQNISQERIDTVRLFAEEIRALQKETLENDLEKLKLERTKWLTAEVVKFAGEHKSDGNQKFAEFINEFMGNKIKEIFGEWRAKEEDVLNANLKKILIRLTERINEILKRIISVSAELFGISGREFKIQEALPSEIEFRFQTFDEQGALSIIIDMARKTLPKVIAHKLILKEAQGKAAMLVDQHCGKARYDFAQRMDKLVRNYRMIVDSTVESLHNDALKALEAGLATKRKADSEASVRQINLQGRISDLKNIEKSINEIAQNHI
jgi:small GTP-binding protein